MKEKSSQDGPFTGIPYRRDSRRSAVKRSLLVLAGLVLLASLSGISFTLGLFAASNLNGMS